MAQARFVSADEAAARIPDGAVVSISGAWMNLPDRILAAVGKRFLETGKPAGLTAIYALCPGGTEDQPGIEHLAHAGLLRRVIGGSFPNLPHSRLRALIHGDAIEAYNLPAGWIGAWFREVGARRPGLLTRAGLATFLEPGNGGGRMNQRTTRDILSVVELDGARHLFFPGFPVEVSLIRATTADEDGNLTAEEESGVTTSFVQAAAARASGGVTIAQVKRVVRAGALHPHQVKVPGTLVDFVVVDERQLQAGGIAYDPALCGESRRELTPERLGTDAERWLAARALRVIRPDDVVVLGYGVSAYVPYLLLEQGRFETARFAVEHGSTGGLPLVEFGFGSSVNPQAILDAASQLELFQGGCFDLALLSFLQVDARGRVNVHRLDARPHLSAGIGGFLDIASGAPRLAFVGFFSAGGLELDVSGDTLRIVREGKSVKFVSAAEYVSFDPAYGNAAEVLYITERCTFRWRDGRLVVVEAAPGVDVNRDVVARLEFAVDAQLARE